MFYQSFGLMYIFSQKKCFQRPWNFIAQLNFFVYRYQLITWRTFDQFCTYYYSIEILIKYDKFSSTLIWAFEMDQWSAGLELIYYFKCLLVQWMLFDTHTLSHFPILEWDNTVRVTCNFFHYLQLLKESHWKVKPF